MIVGICDDEKNARELIEAYIRKIDDACTILHFENGEAVLKYAKQGNRIDVLYLDIDLKGSPDGMAIAGRLKDKQIKEGTGAYALPLIIFVTGLPERIQEAFGVRAFQFLVKPIDEKQFRLVYSQAKRAVLSIPKGHKSKSISVGTGGVKRTIVVSDIKFIESNGRKLIFHTKDGNVEIYGTMADIQGELDEAFTQVHRSFIVNMGFISDYTRNSVKIAGGDSVPMSKYKYRDFVGEYAKFLEIDE